MTGEKLQSLYPRLPAARHELDEEAACTHHHCQGPHAPPAARELMMRTCAQRTSAFLLDSKRSRDYVTAPIIPTYYAQLLRQHAHNSHTVLARMSDNLQAARRMRRQAFLLHKNKQQPNTRFVWFFLRTGLGGACTVGNGFVCDCLTVRLW